MPEWWTGGRGVDGRPTMGAIAGDSGAGKTTITKGIDAALGPTRVVSACTDDYHAYGRDERKELAAEGRKFTPLSPLCNYMRFLERDLEDLKRGEPILKPVYNHKDGSLGAPVPLEPREFVIVEGLLPLYTRLSQSLFDMSVYLDPPEPVRFGWKIDRDVTKRGYKPEEVAKDLARRELESAAFIRPERAEADIVVRFSPIFGRDEIPEDWKDAFEPGYVNLDAAEALLNEDEDALVEHRAEAEDRFRRSWDIAQLWAALPERPALSATILLRPTIPHPNLARIINSSHEKAVHLKLDRDELGRPVDALHIHSYAPRELTHEIEKAIWAELDVDEPLPESLGQIGPGVRSEPLAITQLLLLYNLRKAEMAGR